jgi:hypothetical protein
VARKPKIPSYRLHKATGQAVVVLDGRSFYLGSYDTPASRAEYDRVIAEWLANKRQSLPAPSSPPPASHAPPATACSDLTVTELCVAYWKHVETYYVKHGEPTSEQDNVRQALRFVRKQYGTARAADFGTLALQAVRDAMIRHPVARMVKAKDKGTGEVRLVEKVYRCSTWGRKPRPCCGPTWRG